ncbi:hypothetical protein EVAR_40427_1 [Eumeta japonica]|uniref:Uncharacterized protein n=1 Tax=Eumeta variegata TaxID=151549 RepID=A0A4C1SBQ4_EUMVA|nr:hypothetical protein EVAR_40427_1 [Eumeta japonica]
MRAPPRTRPACTPVDAGALALGYFQMVSIKVLERSPSSRCACALNGLRPIASSVGVLILVSYFVINFQELVAYRTHSRQEDEELQKLVPLSLELLRLLLCLIMAIVLVIGVNKADRIQRGAPRIVGDLVVAGQLDPLILRRDVASLCLLNRGYQYYKKCFEELLHLVSVSNLHQRPLAGNTIRAYY